MGFSPHWPLAEIGRKKNGSKTDPRYLTSTLWSMQKINKKKKTVRIRPIYGIYIDLRFGDKFIKIKCDRKAKIETKEIKKAVKVKKNNIKSFRIIFFYRFILIKNIIV